ncbi:2-dehydro-3-deoxygluconokinase [Nocardioides baekrokdamisoli]|uniref:2-dehydro-3-deoxygluconokinase n=1 Tax=Nocardioides baekrokdamisoli TaxID=1804624 RepID=A0A3G9J3H2_9ACTN|nr:sugar kinase [Nocardioides baekrokdamisoli]BBH17559.1 2-dehydro-3-deoxygluconokinase [Nocardioides baekrokdamisoli]
MTVVQSIGECMVEVARGTGQARIDYSGDTFNTAVYLARAARSRQTPVDVRYLTGVGDDAESARMRARWREEGISDDALVVPGRTPGLYMITTDGGGERSFSYWRSESAAAAMFAGSEWVDLVCGDYVYLSGITLQLTSAISRHRLVSRLSALRESGTKVVFDSNFRPQGWASVEHARTAMDEVLHVTDIALVTWEDEHMLTGCEDIVGCVERLVELGIHEIVVKDGEQGSWVAGDGHLTHVATQAVVPVDTTAAGDSFNGAYLAARIAGEPPLVAAAAGSVLASEVVRHRGAIIDLSHAVSGLA